MGERDLEQTIELMEAIGKTVRTVSGHGDSVRMMFQDGTILDIGCHCGDAFWGASGPELEIKWIVVTTKGGRDENA